MACPRLTNVAPPGLCLFMLYHFRGLTPPLHHFVPSGLGGNVGKPKGASPRLLHAVTPRLRCVRV